MKLRGKAALVTGATSGIGRATALLFAAEGACVCLVGRDHERGAEGVRQIERGGGRAIFVAADVARPEDCARAVTATIDAFGALDVLFNNAGIYIRGTVPDCSPDEWERTIATNLTGTFLMTRAALPTMLARGSGVVVNNASDWGLVGGEEAAAYCASKGGVILLTKCLALDHGAAGLRFNALCPGDVETPMLRRAAYEESVSWRDYEARSSAERPLGRMGRAEEIARAALFLACEDSSFMTGATLLVDGGYTAR